MLFVSFRHTEENKKEGKTVSVTEWMQNFYVWVEHRQIQLYNGFIIPLSLAQYFALINLNLKLEFCV